MKLFYAPSPKEVLQASAPILAAFVWVGFREHHPPVVIAACLAAGALVWSFVEYWLHRGLFHASPESRWLSRMLVRVHIEHHHDMTDPRVLNAGPAVSIPVTVCFFGAALLVFRDLSRASLFMVGMKAGYLFYEIVHYEVHAGRSRLRLFEQLRRNHIYHHRVEHGANLGVSSRLWDHVFGTTREALRRAPTPSRRLPRPPR